jgi:hypothetical protein
VYNSSGGIVVMFEMMKKHTFLELIRLTHDQLETALKELTLQQWETPGSSEGWGIKEIVAHITWYEAEMIKVLETRSLHGSDWWDLPLDKRNELIHQSYLTKTPRSVIDGENETYRKMMDLLELLSEDDLNDPGAFAGMPAEWKPWSVIASNTNEHYPEHIRQIKVCLKTYYQRREI